ncbi:MAG: ABC transporter permease [Alphaproteobacteria bacterium]|jgi:NitT/TauT family transport system permease protein
MANSNGGKNLFSLISQIGGPSVIFFVMLVLWQVIVILLKVPQAILPTPLVIIETMAKHWELLMIHSWPTLSECLMGFGLAVVVGMGLGISLAFFPKFHNSVYPLIVAFQVVPKVALAPLFIVWFGLGTLSRVLLAFVIAFFPMVVNTYAGILSTDPLMVRMAHSFNANRWTVFCKIEFPNALPYIFSGLKIGITFAVIGIIVAEFVTAQKGLGYLIVFAEGNIDTPLLMAAITVLSVIGVVLYAAIVALEKMVVTWDVGQDLH